MGSSSSTAKKQKPIKAVAVSKTSDNSSNQEPVKITEEKGPTNTAAANQKSALTDKSNQKLAHSDTANQKKTTDTDKSNSASASQKRETIYSSSQKPSFTGLGEMDRWQDADLAGLLSGLSLDDDADIWKDTVDQLVTRYDPKIQPEKQRKGWKTVRLFVSSTFKDMWNERDYLVKKVFPQLRQWCEERKLRLVECDLRWGVPKDADTRETLLACLSEIDRCREENGYPYFLNLMSERYGWVPKMHEVPGDVRAKYKLIPGLSVTAVEIMVGGYWDRNTNALYMLRTPSYLEQIEDKTALSYYTEPSRKYKESLETLKEKLRSKYPKQVHDYTCKVDSIKDGKVFLSGLEEMGDLVLKHFKKCLEYQYPTDNIGQEPSLIEILKMEHETFMFQRSQVLLGRDKEVDRIQNYIDSDSDKPLVMIGFPGSGKSSMAAYMVKKCLQNNKFKVFYHFIGATPRSTDVFQILSRFFMEHMPKGTKMPEDLDEMMRFSRTMFNTATEQALKEGCTKFILIIDALNQMDDDGDAQKLVWLPKQLPRGMKLIVSTLEGNCLEALREVQSMLPEEISINPLDSEIRKNIVEKVLGEYNKKLDSEQMNILVSKADAGRPLWLTIACEELRVFGEFRQLTKTIKELPEDLIGLLEMVLKRIVNEFGGDLVVATLCLVETSRFGLLETELLELLAIQPTLPGAKTVQDLAVEGKLPMAKWALAYVGLRQFLRPCGSAGEGRLDFHHRTISKVVRKMFLNDQANIVWWHKRIAEYFSTCRDIERKAEELPYQLERADDKNKLKEVLTDQPMFNQLYTESTKQQLMKYWRFIGGYNIASQAYVTSLNEYLRNMHLTDIALVEPIQTKVAWFLTDIGEYDAATSLLKEIIDQVTVQHGRTSKLLLNALHCIVYLLYRKALQYVYGASEGYRECSRLGSKYAQDCYEVHKLHNKDETKLSHVLVLCGYFGGKEVLEEARAIFDRTGDHQGLAQALYMLGEKNQYHHDMNVPIQLFTKSLTLCLSSFGKVHLHTARALQLFGQLYWNRWISNKRQDWLERCLELYQQELEILEEILGMQHVTTVRSREDVVIILQNLGRHDEANKIQAQQPAHHNALYGI